MTNKEILETLQKEKSYLQENFGLVRSTGGDKRGLLGRTKEEREKGDARILGSGISL